MTRSKKYFYVLAGFLALILLLSILVKKEYSVQTEMTINAPSNYIFNVLKNLSHHDEWNAKAMLDTSYHLTCAGKADGAGVSCDYTSQMYGNGIIRITEAQSNALLMLTDEPENGKTQTFTYTLTMADSVTTKVGVLGTGKSGFITNLWNFIHKWKLKKHIHQNLDNLKVLVINRFKNNLYNGYEVKSVVMNQKYFITLRSKVSFENLQQYYTQNISALYQKALENKLTITGMPCGLYYTWNEEGKFADMAAALPTLAEFNIQGTEAVQIPSKQALIIEYKGENSKSGIAHLCMDEYMADRLLESDLPVIEEYMTDPTKEADPSKYVTHIIYYTHAIR